MIKLENITKTYSMGEVTVNALAGVSFEIDRGEMVSIMGSSGSGKSTLMNILGCLDTPTSGRYFLDGEEVNGLSDNELAAVRNRKIGFVFQQFNLLARTSALDNVELPQIYSSASLDHERALQLLDKVGMGKRLHHTPTQLSGGEQQRVAIARALMNAPPILLADEPTGNLDSRNAAEIMALLKQLNREDGITIVMVTHDPNIGDRSPRVITLRDGMLGEDLRKTEGDNT
jgi:putative ABC transport system ATP-binding protein